MAKSCTAITSQTLVNVYLRNELEIPADLSTGMLLYVRVAHPVCEASVCTNILMFLEKILFYPPDQYFPRM